MSIFPQDPPAIVEQAERFGEELVSVKSVINRLAEQMAELKQERKLITEKTRSIVENDEKIAELEKAAEAPLAALKTQKSKLKETPEFLQLRMKEKELREEENEIKQSLSNHLNRYFVMTGSQIFETSGGDEVEFTVKAQIKPKQLKLFES